MTTNHPAVGDVYLMRNTGERVRISRLDENGNAFIVDPDDGEPILTLAVNRSVFHDFDSIELVEPYTCGECGFQWHYETPASRCPHEADHEAVDLEPTWNVYSLTDGLVDDEEGFDDLDAACLHYASVVAQYTELADRGKLTADVTVHLYHPGWGSMQAEHHIGATA